jgi:DNA-binding MarR family transcriptional regulator/GNAT superfamily N-acetyltransferase
MADDHVAAIRRFDRAYSQRLRRVTEAYAEPGRALGPAMVLIEVGDRDGVQGPDLRRRLDLDSGYMSRTLRELEDEGLVAGRADRVDRRRRVLRLTATGRRVVARAVARADAAAGDLLAPLRPQQRAELVAALATAEQLLRAATVTFDVVRQDSPDAVAARSAYFAELDRRFPRGFDPGGPDEPGVFVVVRDDDDVVGCGMVVPIDDRTAEVKRRWIAPAWRGMGLGVRLLAHLEDVAHDRRHRRVVLDTNATLTEAIAMYERSGYSAIERYNDNPYAERWFAKTLRARRK